MPRRSSTWVDIRIHLFIIFAFSLILMLYNIYVGAFGLILLSLLFVYGRERCHDRERALEDYYSNVVKNINELSNYAIDNLPLAIMVLNHQGRLQWVNDEFARWLGEKPEIGIDVRNYWENLDINKFWDMEGEFLFSEGRQTYEVKHRPIISFEDSHGLMVLYVKDITAEANMKHKYEMGKKVIAYVQIDNHDEVLQGLNEAERTEILVELNQLLDEWIVSIGGFIKRIAQDMYVAVLDRRALNKMIDEKCDILDKVRAIHGANKFPVTISMGVAVEEENEVSLAELGNLAQAGLDLALGRGGDQIAVNLEGKMHFFGGKAKAVEKHTRVKARVVSHAMNEIIGTADLVLVMGHHNEDFDSFGAALGVARMAKHLGKKTYVVLSDITTGVQKFTDILKEYKAYDDLFIHAGEAASLMASNPLLIVVDTHIPQMTAAPALLDRIENIIVIDHHRRSESFINSPLLIYIEPSSSSTSELVTELLMYFSDDLELTRMDATALYSGIVVDTKNFTVQAGVRTFDAAAHLRRCGADPTVVRHLFRSDYESVVAHANAVGNAQMYKGGLIVTTCPSTQNAQITSAQVADSMLRIEDVRMSIVLFPLEGGGVGVSARSTGELNVQVIMEQIGGGGHQNVAGAQVKDADLEELREKVVEISSKYIEESEQK